MTHRIGSVVLLFLALEACALDTPESLDQETSELEAVVADEAVAVDEIVFKSRITGSGTVGSCMAGWIGVGIPIPQPRFTSCTCQQMQTMCKTETCGECSQAAYVQCASDTWMSSYVGSPIPGCYPSELTACEQYCATVASCAPKCWLN